jgi:hypothetical protein
MRSPTNALPPWLREDQSIVDGSAGVFLCNTLFATGRGALVFEIDGSYYDYEYGLSLYFYILQGSLLKFPVGTATAPLGFMDSRPTDARGVPAGHIAQEDPLSPTTKGCTLFGSYTLSLMSRLLSSNHVPILPFQILHATHTATEQSHSI